MPSSRTSTDVEHATAVLVAKELNIDALDDDGVLHLVEDLDLTLEAGKITGLAGESGSGKTVTALALMQLTRMSGLTVHGSIQVNGREIGNLRDRELRRVRGAEISMVFQEPMTSLDPNYRVGSLIAETIQSHEKVSAAVARERAIELLDRVGIPDPGKRVDLYPFEMSGGQLQRVMIAMAISCNPSVLIADEPTTALDVTVQAQVMSVLRSLAEDGMAILLVTHDLGVMAQYADDLYVMYAGQVIEHGATNEVLHAPKHPYSAGLIASVPTIHERIAELHLIPGRVPNPRERGEGCRFASRCEYTAEECAKPMTLRELDGRRSARCIRTEQLSLTGVDQHG